MSGRDVGEGKLQEWLECRCADLNGLEGEGIYIEKRENRFADIEKGETKKTNREGQRGQTKVPYGLLRPLFSAFGK